MTQTGLSRAIAATGDKWHQTGAVALCPCGERFIRLSTFWTQDGNGPHYAHDLTPDLDSDATAGVLLGLMPTGGAWTDDPHVFTATDGAGGYLYAPTRNEAIARAYVASKGAM